MKRARELPRSARAGVAALLASLVVIAAAVSLASPRAAGHVERRASATSQQGLSTGPDAGVLAATVSPDLPLAHDGDGIATVTLADVTAGRVAVSRVTAAVELSGPARARSVRAGAGWRCTVLGRGRRVWCRLPSGAKAASSLRPIAVDVVPGRPGRRVSYGPAAIRVRASWRQPGITGGTLARDSTAQLALTMRPPLTVGVHATYPTVIDHISGVASPITILKGTVGRRTDEPIRFAWRQLCTGRSCPRVKWTTPTRGLLVAGEQPIAGWTAPQVKRVARLRFALSASDPRGTVRRVVSVRVLPDAIDRINPRLGSVALGGKVVRSAAKPVTAVPLTGADRAAVSINGNGVTDVATHGLVRLVAKVSGQRLTGTEWHAADGPHTMLAGAKRSRTTLEFHAPATPGTYAVRMTAFTQQDRFTREEIVEVRPAVTARAAAAEVSTPEKHAFCALVREARKSGEISISMPSGGTFAAKADRPAGNADQCSGTETLDVHGGHTELGSFGLEALSGKITLERGLVIEKGALTAPKFWGEQPLSSADTKGVQVMHGPLRGSAAEAGGGPRIDFAIPQSPDISVGLGIPLSGGGFGDLSGEVAIDKSFLSKFPIGSALPGNGGDAWSLQKIRLSVVPAARQFVLEATANGPSGGALSLYGVLTFDGVVSVSVVGSNLAVFESAGGQQTTLTAHGTLTMLPGRRSDSNGSSFFPVVDVEVGAEINNYEPVKNVKLSGRVSWSSHGALELGAKLVTAVHGGTNVEASVTGSYEDANNWLLYAELSAGDQGLPIGNPAVLTLKKLTGELQRKGGDVNISLKGEAANIKGIDGVHVKSAEVQFTTACQREGEQPATGSNRRVCLLVKADLELKVPGSGAPLTVTGALRLDFSTLKFEVSGEIPAGTKFGPSEFKLEHVRLFATNDTPPAASCETGAKVAAAGGLSYGFTASATVRGLPVDVTGAYLAGETPQYCFGASIGAADLPSGNSDSLRTEGVKAPETASCKSADAPALQKLRFDYSSVAKAGTFSGRFCLPKAARDRLGTLAQGTGTVELTLTDDGFTGRAKYDLENQVHWLLNGEDKTKAALGFRSLEFKVWATKSNGLGLGLDARGEVRLPAPTAASGGADTAPSHAPVKLGASVVIAPNPQLTFAAELGTSDATKPCTAGDAVIHKAFDQDGFNICQLGLGGTIGASGFGIGVSAKFTLPSKWGTELGAENASFVIGFKISATAPCLNLGMSQVNTSKPALDLFRKGAIIADQAALRIAPTGCELPDGGPPLPAGISVAFKGKLFSTPTSIDLKLERRPTGLKVDLTQNTGPSSLGPLKFGDTHIRFLADPDTSTTALQLKTSIAIGSGRFEIDAAIHSSGAGTSRKTKIDATSSLNASLLGAKFDGKMELHFESAVGATSDAQTTADFSGRLRADLKIFKTDVDVKTLKYDSSKGGLQALDFKASAEVSLGPAKANGAFGVFYARQPETLKLSVNGGWSLWGVDRGHIEKVWDLSRIEIPFTIASPQGSTFNAGVVILKVAGDMTGSLAWTPSGGFHLTTDLKAFSLRVCDPFNIGCSTLTEVHVNKDTGEVTGSFLGIKYSVKPSQYAAGIGQYIPPPISNEGVITGVASHKCVDVTNGDTRDGTVVKVINCHDASKDGNVPREWRLAQRWLLNASGNIREANRGVCLDNNGSGVYILHCIPNNPNQRWRIDFKGRIIGLHDRCLDAPGADTSPSVDLAMRTCDDSASQRWAMSGSLRLVSSSWCAGGKDGSTGSFTQLVLVRCDGSTTNPTFKTSADGRLHITDTQCVTPDDRPGRGNAAIILPCENRPTLESTKTFELINGRVKPAGINLCLEVPQHPAAGAALKFDTCGGKPLQQGWDFGRFLTG